jgi:hypothetical protein
VNSGNCPACKELISKDDLAILRTPLKSIAWVCRKCKTIIGFQSGVLGLRGGISDSEEEARRHEEELQRMDDDRMMFEHYYS